MTSMKPTDTVPPSTLLDAAKKAAQERSDTVKEAKEAADKMVAVAPSALPMLPKAATKKSEVHKQRTWYDFFFLKKKY